MDPVESADVYDALRVELARLAAAAGGRGAAGDIVKESVRRAGAGHSPWEIEDRRAELYRAIVKSAHSARHTSEVDRIQSPPVLGTSPESLALDPRARDALLSLRPRHRAVAYLVHWQGLSIDETARLLGCSRRAARRSLRVAARHLSRVTAQPDREAETIRAIFDTLVEPVPETPDGQELASFIAAAPPMERRLLGGSRRQRRAWLLAGAVVALAGVGGVTLLFGGGGDRAEPVIAQSGLSTTLPAAATTLPAPATTLAAVTTTAPTMLPAPFPMSWEVVEGAGIKDFAGSVIVDENGWVAAGVEGLAEISGDPEAVGWAAAFWISVDGIDWERIPHDDGVFGNADDFAVAMDVTAGGPGYVAVGYAIDREGYDLTRGAEWIRYQMGSEYIDASVWLSEDGRLWSRVESAGLGGPGWQMLNGVTAAGPGLVAVGFRQDVGSGVWTSVDGSEWQAVEPSPFEKGSNVWGVYSDSQGLLAVGNIDLQPAIWSSEDGVSWEASRLTPEGADIRGETQAVVRMGDTIIGAGFAAEDPEMGEHVAGIWVSNDSGATWDQVPPFTSTVRVTDIFGLASTPQGLVIGGMVYDWGDPDWARAGLWVSVDNGTTWQAVPNEDDLLTDGAVFEVVVFEEKVFAFGSKRDGSGGKGAAWIGEWTN